ncbi:hypothetical protein MAR_034478 [Mya arenaria]|uniref:Uncharacterized protein n=1 Tax=Mya arenaria TaxID=6604 RepID=A0ABY7GG99_MYAAR|nr:hypothetical protein MAR_034478 [Mya arenaria]
MLSAHGTSILMAGHNIMLQKQSSNGLKAENSVLPWKQSLMEAKHGNFTFHRLLTLVKEGVEHGLIMFLASGSRYRIAFAHHVCLKNRDYANHTCPLLQEGVGHGILIMTSPRARYLLIFTNHSPEFFMAAATFSALANVSMAPEKKTMQKQ